MTKGIMHDQNLEKHIQKQMGCMAGFFHLFDRRHILTWKRLYITKHLPSASKLVGSKSVGLPALSHCPDRSRDSQETEIQSTAAEIVTPAEKHVKSPPPLPIFKWKDETRSSLKLRKEAPRFSLDSRATITPADGDDVRRSPSVVARLMGLEQLPQPSQESAKNAELRRSASESRLLRDRLPYQFTDNNNFPLKQPNQSHSCNVSRNNASVENSTTVSFNVKNSNSEPSKPRGVGASPRKSSQQRKSYFDSVDFFPEPKQTASIYGVIERRLKMRGMDEKSNNVEALKQILDAVQLKGLLHSHKPTSQRNFVHGRTFSSYKFPIVVMKPSKSPVSPRKQRIVTDSPVTGYGTGYGVCRSLNFGCECSPGASPRRERPETDRSGMYPGGGGMNLSSPTRREIKAKNPNSPAIGRPLNVETQKRGSSVNSPKRIGSDQLITNRSPRYRKPTAQNYPKEKNGIVITVDESSSIFGNSSSTFSETDTEKWKMKECKEENSLLKRCDKLLHSISEMTATELQPSPVSVLDESLYKDESFSPSPVMKRSIDFGEQQEFEEEIGSPVISPIQLKCEDTSDDCDFIYISELIRYSNYHLQCTDLFLLLEKQQDLKGNDTSYDSRLQRKLVFDTVVEILDREKHLPPWKTVSSSSLYSVTEKASLNQIWIQFQKIRERDTTEDLVEMICGVLRKDLAAGGWVDTRVEISEAVLDIERMIFKDLIGETIRDLRASDWSNNVIAAPCRKLVFTMYYDQTAPPPCNEEMLCACETRHDE